MSRASRRTAQSIKSTEQLMEAIELATTAWKEQVEYKEALATWVLLQNESNESGSPKSSLSGLLLPSKPTPPAERLELGGVQPHRYLLNAISSISSPLMYETVIALPFSFAEKVSE